MRHNIGKGNLSYGCSGLISGLTHIPEEVPPVPVELFAGDTHVITHTVGDLSDNSYRNDHNQKINLPKATGNKITKLSIYWRGIKTGTPSGLGIWYIGLALTAGGDFVWSTSFNPDTKTSKTWESFEISPGVTINQDHVYIRLWRTVNTDYDSAGDSITVCVDNAPVDTDESWCVACSPLGGQYLCCSVVCLI